MSTQYSRTALRYGGHWLMVLASLTAAVIVIFEIIPMSMIPMVSATPTLINTRPAIEHNIAIPFYPSLSHFYDRKSARQNSNNEKLLHCTFRTSENIIKELKKEASSRGIPFSILLNNIVKSHLAQTNTEKADFIVIGKEFFRKIFGKIDEKSLDDYGMELCSAVVSDYTASYFPDINGHTIVQFLEKWFTQFQSYQHRFDGGNSRHSFSLNHDISMNFSIVLRVILEGLVEPVVKNKVIFGETASNRITFSFDV